MDAPRYIATADFSLGYPTMRVFLVSEILKSSVVDWREASTELVLYVENVQLALIYCWFGPHRVETKG